MTTTRQVCGRLHLGFATAPATQRTALTIYDQQPPLRVVRAFELAHGAALVHLHNISGGVLGGDTLEMRVEVAAQARAQITSTGATRLYRSRGGVEPAQQMTHFTVGAGGLLEYLPDTLIPFAGARYHQSTRVELAEDAGLFWWEIVAPGRVGRGELFAYERLFLETEITAAGRDIVRERVRLEPQRHTPASLARLGPYRYYASFYVCRVGLEPARWRELEAQLQEVAAPLSRPGVALWGISTLPAHGLTIRAVGQTNHALTAGLTQLWQAARVALYGQTSDPPRKMY
jgi:urease accessory protein